LTLRWHFAAFAVNAVDAVNVNSVNMSTRTNLLNAARRFHDNQRNAAAFRLIYRRAIGRLYRGIAAPKPKGAADENPPPRRRPATAVRRVRAKR
jgi:hypothetical protein